MKEIMEAAMAAAEEQSDPEGQGWNSVPEDTVDVDYAQKK